MALLRLPLEILDQIIDLTLPIGIEAFACSCKAIYQRATSQITRHNRLKRRWRHATNLNRDRGDTLRILCEVYKDPLVAEYIESLNLWDRRPGVELPDAAQFDANARFRSDAETMEGIQRMVKRSQCLDMASVDVDAWWQIMMKEDQEEDEDAPYTTVSLLGQLPNLKVLDLPRGWHVVSAFEDANEDSKRLVSVLDAIVRRANNEPGHPALKNLETLLPFLPEGHEEWGALQCLEPLFTLKNLNHLDAVSCVAVDDDTGPGFQWRYPDLNSQLRRVELAYCCMDADGISQLLSRTPCLTTFKYSHQTKTDDCQYDWNPGAFNEAIARHCGQTLTELAITIDDLPGDIRNGASSFRSFQKLEDMEVDVLILCGPPVESGQERGHGGFVPEGERPWTEEDIPCLGSMLPETIKKVQLNTDFPDMPDDVALELLMKNILEERSKRLQKLDTFIIRQYSGDSAQAVADKAGVSLEAFSMEHMSSRSRAMMPAWKREFERRALHGVEFA